MRITTCLLLLLSLTGCASYHAPGAPADMRTLGASEDQQARYTDPSIDRQFDRLSKLPMMGGVAPVNKMLVTGPCNSEQDLRQIAARLQADMLLVYTFDTQFYVHDYATPVTVISLGLSPNKQAKVTTTASALLIDTRSGYIYGLAEATAESTQLTNAWSSEDAVDDSRLRTERASFEKLVGSVEKTWTGVVSRYAVPRQATR
jgi:hypothetical protein